MIVFRSLSSLYIDVLEVSPLQDVNVSEDKDRNTITLGGSLHSDDAQTKGDRRRLGDIGRLLFGIVGV